MAASTGMLPPTPKPRHANKAQVLLLDQPLETPDFPIEHIPNPIGAATGGKAKGAA